MILGLVVALVTVILKGGTVGSVTGGFCPRKIQAKVHTVKSPIFVIGTVVMNTHSSLVCDGQTSLSPHSPRLVVSHSTCPPLSPSPHANCFVKGTTVKNTHTVYPTSSTCLVQYYCCPGSHTGHNRKGHSTWPENHLRQPVRASIGMVPHDCGIAPLQGWSGHYTFTSIWNGSFLHRNCSLGLLISLPHASEWVAGQNLEDPTTWTSSTLQPLRL
jgi:hypothetical protein